MVGMVFDWHRYGTYRWRGDWGDPDQEIAVCEFGTGVDRETARKVLRWFLGYPEPDCEACQANVAKWDFSDQLNTRCQEHLGYGPYYEKRYAALDTTTP